MSFSTQNPDMYVIEQILADKDSWHNIQPIIISEFKAIADFLNLQSKTIHDLEIQLSNKVTKHELSAELAEKASISELSSKFSHVQNIFEGRITLIDEKVSLSEVQKLLMNKASYEDVKSMIEGKANNRELKTEIDRVYEQLNLVYKEIQTALLEVPQMQDLKDLNEEVKAKIEKNEVEKIVTDEIQIMLNEVVHIQDFQKLAGEIKEEIKQVEDIINEETKRIEETINKNTEEALNKALKKKAEKSDLQKKADSADIKTLLTAIESKADAAWFEQLNEKISKIEKNELSLKKRIENQFKDMFAEFTKASSSSLDQQFSKHVEELDRYVSELTREIQKVKISTLPNAPSLELVKSELSTKADSKKVELTLQDLRNETIEMINSFRSENNLDRAHIKDFIIQKTQEDDKSGKMLQEELEFLRGEIQNIKKFHEKNWESLRNWERNKNDINADIRDTVEKLLKFRDMLELKIDRKEFDEFSQNIVKYLDHKADINEVEEILQGKNKQLIGIIQDLKEDIKIKYGSLQHETLEKAKNLIKRNYEEKDFEQMLSERVRYKDFDVLSKQIDELRQEIKNINENTLIDELKDQIKSLNDQIAQKAPIEIYKLIDSKPNIDNINETLLSIHNEIDTKLPTEDFSNFIEDQNIIINTLCSEICLGRWLWKSGKLKKTHFIPWEVQSINTNPQLFLWEEERIYIGIEDSGVYEFTVGVYSEEQANIQLILNGEPIITSTSGKEIVKQYNKCVGFSFVEFLSLPRKSRLSLSYSGDSKGEGFIGLRKL